MDPTSSAPVQVFIYARVSTKEQIEGDGFARQIETCRKFCEQRGWTVLRVFREQQSGSVEALERPKLAEAINLCGGALGVNIIVVERTDRIARDLIVAELFYRECRERAIRIYAADSEQEVVNATGDPTTTLIRQVLGAVSQWVKSEIVRKLQAGRRRKSAQTGRPCGGPVGYGEDENHPAFRHQQRVCKLIVGLRQRRRLSFERIARMLNIHSDRTPAPRGSRWTDSTVCLLYHRWADRVTIAEPVKVRRAKPKTLAERLKWIPAFCSECGIESPGHRLDCKTSNERARRYQDSLTKSHE